MDSKAIIAIAVVAILVVAGACVYVFVLNKDKDPSDHYETLRDIAVGDEIELKNSVTVTLNYEESGQANDFLEWLYFDGEGTLTGEQTMRYKSTDYECYVYEVTDDEETAEVYIIKESGVMLKMAGDDKNATLADTNLDVTKGIEDQEISNDSFYKYDVKMLAPTEESTTLVTGELSIKITETLMGGYKYAYHMQQTGESRKTMELESITGDQYKFKGEETTVSKAGAMQFYSFSEAYQFLVETYGDGIIPGEKKSPTIMTAYGERQVTSQKYSVAIGLGFEAVYDFYYGQDDVLYQCTVLNHIPDDDSHIMELEVTYALQDCDAVTTH